MTLGRALLQDYPPLIIIADLSIQSSPICTVKCSHMGFFIPYVALTSGKIDSLSVESDLSWCSRGRGEGNKVDPPPMDGIREVDLGIVVIWVEEVFPGEDKVLVIPQNKQTNKQSNN